MIDRRTGLRGLKLSVLLIALLLLGACSFSEEVGRDRVAASATEQAGSAPHGLTPATAATMTAPPAPSATARPSATPTPTATATPTLDSLNIVGYLGYVVEQERSLEQIAQLGGSDPWLIQRYNRLTGEPFAGRELIVPMLEGRPVVLESSALMISRGHTQKPWVALTFDAGADSRPTPQILATLRERGVRVTFFLTGKWMRDNPELVRQIVADGHEIANHSFNHPYFTTLTDAEIAEELRSTEAALHEIVGEEAGLAPYFRPPFGDYDRRVLELVIARGYLPVYWTFDSKDSVGEPKTPEFLIERVTGALPPEQLPGAIILVHCGSQPTADALPAILDRFAALGIEVRTLTDVLEP